MGDGCDGCGGVEHSKVLGIVLGVSDRAINHVHQTYVLVGKMDKKPQTHKNLTNAY